MIGLKKRLKRIKNMDEGSIQMIEGVITLSLLCSVFAVMINV